MSGCHNSNHNHMTVSLPCTDIHLASPGELVEGQPLKLTCTVFGHTPKDNNKVKIYYWSSGEPIANCSSNATEAPNSDFDSDYDILTNTCELSAHSTQSNSGDYSCSASIEDMEVSSENVALNVEPRKTGKKTIIGAAVGSGAGLIVLALLAIVISVIIRRRRNQEEHHDGAVGENAGLLRNGPASIGGNIISKGHHFIMI